MNYRPTILVTGATGFVGCWLVENLLGTNARVVGLGRLPAGSSHPQTAGNFTLEGEDDTYRGGVRYRGEAGSWSFIPCALEDLNVVRELVATIAPDLVYHLAAQSSAGLSFRDPFDTFTSNVTGCLNLLEAVREQPAAGWPNIIAVGSCEEYGSPGRTVPLTEQSPLRPVSPYGVSKVTQTLLCRQYHRSYGMPIVTVRAFSHTGPGQDTRFAFPSFARQIAAAENNAAETRLTVGNLAPVRDYLDVRDVVSAYRRLVTHGEPGEVYNVSSGRALTIQEGLEILLESAQCAIEVVPDPERQRPADIPYMVGDSTKLRAQTGWRPEHGIRETLLDMLAWARKEFA